MPRQNKRRPFGSWYRDPKSLFFPKFLEKDGRIIIDWRQDDGASFRPYEDTSTYKVARDELNWNFITLERYWAEQPFENWRINLAIAQAVRECWLAQLGRQFPGLTFRTPIRHLLLVCADDDDRITSLHSIVPKIYLWSDRGDPDNELMKSFGEFTSDEMIGCPIKNRHTVSSSEVFTRSGDFNKLFVRQLSKATVDHHCYQIIT